MMGCQRLLNRSWHRSMTCTIHGEAESNHTKKASNRVMPFAVDDIDRKNSE
jgi:hypothetical protein